MVGVANARVCGAVQSRGATRGRSAGADFLWGDAGPSSTLWDKLVLPLYAEFLQPLHEVRHEPGVWGVLQPFHDFEVITSDVSGFAGGV